MVMEGVVAEGSWLGGNKDELQYRQQQAAEADLWMADREPVMTEDPTSHQAYRQEAHLRAGTSGLAPHAEEGPPSWPRQEVGADLADIAARQQNLALPSSTQAMMARHSGGDLAAGNLSGFVTPPHLAPAQAEFSVGDQVLYWSETHNLEMDAKVEKVNKDQDGYVISYDLDCKRNAAVSKLKCNRKGAEQPYHFGGVHQYDHEQPPVIPDKLPEMMREVPSPTPGVNAALGGAVAPLAVEKPLSYGGAGAGAGLLEAPSPVVPQPALAAPEVVQRFQLDEQVEYWSDTFSQWMPAKVIRIRDGSQYDLDVKKGAQAKKMRKAGEGAAANPGGAMVPVTTSQAAADAAQGQMAPRAALAGSVPPRVLSPLSGRGRGVEGAEEASRQVASGAMAAQAGRPRLGAPASATPAAAPLLGAGTSMRSTTSVTPALTDATSAASVALRQAVQPVTSVAGAASAAGQALTSAAPRTSVGGASPQRLRGAPGGRSETPAAPGMTAAHASAAAAAVAAGGGTPPAGQAFMKATNGGYNVVRQDASASSPKPQLFMGTGVPTRDNPGLQAKQVEQHNGRSGMLSGHRTSLVGGGAVASPGCSSRCRPALEEGTLHIDSGNFNPSNQSVRQQLLNALNLGPHSVIEEMQGFRGGLNEGVWYLGDPAQGQKNGGRQELVLKLVKCSRLAPNIPTEAENFLKISKEHPAVVNDPLVAFPIKVFSCTGPGGIKRYDLIIMRKVRGERMAELIARMWYAGQVQRLMQIMEQLGGCLADFHNHYGNSEHGDFQPSNIFYDEEREEIAFIDVGGMGIPTTETDIQHFTKSMDLLGASYAPQLAVDCVHYFNQGYDKRKR
mmetsp:Transcript_23035/g.49015  ORF Transcript_23035/g.49015 Transcript_23035/m.49015 type:complete len:843 (-) Transcript_23035:146-2674(-)